MGCRACKEFPDGVLHIWEEEEIIGQLEFAYAKKNGHINLYYLHPRYRRRGYGKVAHEHVICTLQSYGCETAMLRVSPENTQAISFYKKLGWKDLGHDQGYSHVHRFIINL